MKFLAKLWWILVVTMVLAACGGKAEPTPTKTPRPSPTPTPLPTVSFALPSPEKGQPPAQPTATVGPEPTQPAAALMSPLPMPTFTPTPGIEAQPPVPVLAANLVCGEDCNAGDPDGVGLVVLNQQNGQLNIWVAEMDQLGAEQEYQGWLIWGDRLEQAIRFQVDEDGLGNEFAVLPDLKDQPWTDFLVTIEPAEAESETPSDQRALAGPLRSTVMGEALYSRFDMPCQQCHGPYAEGGAEAPPLTALALPFDQFLAKVRSHAVAMPPEVVSDRDLKHMYAWLINTLR